MTYHNKLVVAVKHDRKILRESDGYVTLPFGSEYSILIKNLEARKASVKISIDGRDALGGKSLLVHPNENLELERFIDGDDRHGYKFKFIQKTKEIVEHRGDKLDDGMIRVEFQFEAKKKIVITEEHHHHHHHDWDWPYYPRVRWTRYDYETTCGGGGTSCSNAPYSKLSGEVTYTSSDSAPNPAEGITVEGGDSDQAFYQGYIGELESQVHTIVIRLRGTFNGETPVTKPITVKTKMKCKYCGTVSKSGSKFCAQCSARLVAE